MLLARLLDHLITAGTLRVVDADGQVYTFTGNDPGPGITMRFHDKAVARRLFFNPRLRLGEAFVDGSMTVEDGGIYELLDFLALNIERAPPHPLRPFYAGFGNFMR